MGISATPSRVTTPALRKPYPSILEFLSHRFPQVSSTCWRQRILSGKVHDARHSPVTLETEFLPHQLLYYFREVEQEPLIPFTEKIIYQNDHLLIACKPHFLPVTPGGCFVNECLLNRLRIKTGNYDLTPLHRIDRETAGLVMFSNNAATRGVYSRLFATGHIEKSYQALTESNCISGTTEWTLRTRIVKGEPWFRMMTVPGEANACSKIRLLSTDGTTARFELNPLTGKTHQLRIHLSSLGFRILNDKYYPELQPEQADDFENPLRLIAMSLRFQDPISGNRMEFRTERELPVL